MPANQLQSTKTKSLIELLKNVGIFLRLKEKANADTYGKDFTVFTALGNEFDEKNTHSRFVYEMLRSDGFHGMGAVFLEEFFKKVLPDELPKNIAKIEVSREKAFSKNINGNDRGGFIDLYIETQDCAYPIEVKIGANDQPSQIKRYYDFADKERKKKTIVFYLTLDGHSPSPDSRQDIPDDRIKCITFKETILDWLLKCEELALSKRSQSVAGAIRQYITLIEKLSENQKDIYMDAIQELILSSKDNYLQACAIEKNLTQVRTKMVLKVYEDLEKHINSHPLVCGVLNVAKDIDDLKTFYNKTNTWPQIRIDITPSKLTNIKLYLAIEIENSLYYGVFFTDNSLNMKLQAPKNLAEAFSNEAWKQCVKKHKGKGWFIWWRILHPKYPLNFRTFNGGYEELYDEDCYKIIMAELCKEIDDNLKSIIETGLPVDDKNLEYQ